jgi:hypothetical protein
MSSTAASSPEKYTKPWLAQGVVPNGKLGRGKQRPSADKITVKGCIARERRQETGLTLGLGSPPRITGFGGCCARLSAGGGVNGEVDCCRVLLQGIHWEYTCRAVLPTSIELR